MPQERASDDALRKILALSDPDMRVRLAAKLTPDEQVRLKAMATGGQQSDGRQDGFLGGLWHRTGAPLVELGEMTKEEVGEYGPMLGGLRSGLKMGAGMIAGIPASVVGAAQRGGRQIGEALSADGPSTELGPRTMEAIEAGEVPDTRPEEGMSLGQRLATGASGVANLGAAALPFIPGVGGVGARVTSALIGPMLGEEAEVAAEGDVSGAIGGSLGILAPFAGRAVRGIKPKATQPVTRDINLPSGEKFPVRVTRGQVKEGGVARRVESITRSSAAGKKRFTEADQVTAGDLQAAGKRIADDIGRDRRLDLTGRTLDARINANANTALKGAKTRLDVAESIVDRNNLVSPASNLRGVAAEAAASQEGMMRAAQRSGDASRLAEYRSAAATAEQEAISAMLEGIPESRMGAVMEMLRGQGITGDAPPVPVSDLIRVMRNLRQSVRKLPEHGVGFTGGNVKRMAKAAAQDVDDALRAFDPRFAKSFHTAERQFRAGIETLKHEAVTEILRQKSHKAPEALMSLDPLDLSRVRKAAGAEAFDDAVGALLREEIRRATVPETTGPTGRLTGPRQVRPAPLQVFLSKMEQADRGNKMLNPARMQSLREWVNILQEVADAQNTGTMSIMGSAIDAAAMRAAAEAGVTLPMGGMPSPSTFRRSFGTLAAVAGAARILTSPRGATRNSFRNLIRSTGRPAEYTFWATRLADAMRKDEWVRPWLQEYMQGGGGDDPQTGLEPQTEGTIPFNEVGAQPQGQIPLEELQ